MSSASLRARVPTLIVLIRCAGRLGDLGMEKTADLAP